VMPHHSVSQHHYGEICFSSHTAIYDLLLLYQAAHGVTLRGVDDPISVGAFIAFPSLHDGMLYCEQQYLQVRSVERSRLCPASLLLWV